MKTLAVGELKANFSQILDEIRAGEEITVAFGKKHEKIAVIVPYSKYMKEKVRKLDILAGKANYKISDDFSISEETLLNS